MKRKLIVMTLVAMFLNCAALGHAAIVTFEGLLANADSFYNGDSGTGENSDGWTADDVFFGNSFFVEPTFTFWSGWSYSNVADAVTAGFGNQYAAAPGGGSDGIGGIAIGGTYAMASGDGAFFNLPESFQVRSADFSNATYARRSMEMGDSFAKEFGGPSGNDPDFFRVTLTGYDAVNLSGMTTGAVTVDLADFTSNDNSEDFILNDWTRVDLSGLGDARSVGLSFESSDLAVTDFGTFINTPTYLALDNLTITAVPEPSTLLTLGSAALVGCGTHYRRRRRTKAILL